MEPKPKHEIDSDTFGRIAAKHLDDVKTYSKDQPGHYYVASMLSDLIRIQDAKIEQLRKELAELRTALIPNRT